MKRVTIGGHSLAYRDEGAGPVVVFVHGTPSSSAEFAAVIEALRPSFRCIAVDHLGFGESDKPEHADYSVAAHRERLAAVLAHLGVSDYHLVAHDFGGPIALPLAMQNPERALSVTLMNTWLWPLEDTEPSLRKQKWLLASALMRAMYRYANFSARVMVKAAWGTHRPLTRERHRQYQEMFKNGRERSGTIGFLNAVVDARDPAWHADTDWLRRRPVLLLWGMGDTFISPKTLRRWTDLLPAARVVPLAKVGHFVADEAPELVVDALRSFLPATVATSVTSA